MSTGLGRVDAPFTVGHGESIDSGSSGELGTKPELKRLLVTCLASKTEE